MRWRRWTRSSNAPRGAAAAIPVLLCLLVGACATTRSARSRDAGAPPPATHHALADRLTALLESPETEQALWAVVVRSLDSGDVLFAHHGDRLMMPASTMKIITLAVAAERLGWDYSYETRLLSAAAVVDGVLRGDLIVRGSGDPTINTGAGSGMPALTRGPRRASRPASRPSTVGSSGMTTWSRMRRRGMAGPGTTCLTATRHRAGRCSTTTTSRY